MRSQFDGSQVASIRRGVGCGSVADVAKAHGVSAQTICGWSKRQAIWCFAPGLCGRWAHAGISSFFDINQSSGGCEC